jgi:hypothetical protein
MTIYPRELLVRVDEQMTAMILSSVLAGKEPYYIDEQKRDM